MIYAMGLRSRSRGQSVSARFSEKSIMSHGCYGVEFVCNIMGHPFTSFTGRDGRPALWSSKQPYQTCLTSLQDLG